MSYRTDDLVTGYFEGNPNYKPVSYDDQITAVKKFNETEDIDSKITITAKQVILNNAVKIRLYFKLADGVPINDVKFNVKVMQNGVGLRPQDFGEFGYDEEDGWYFDYAGVMASELDNELIFTATIDGETSLIFHYNVNQYIMSTKDIADYGDLARALFNYGYICDIKAAESSN